MSRTVKVDLILDAAKYKRGVGEAQQSTDRLSGSLSQAAREGERTGRSLDAAADDMSEAARAAQALDGRIDELSASVRNLNVQAAITGDVDIAKKWRAQQAQLTQLSRQRKLLDDGDAGRLGRELGTRIGISTASGMFATLSASFRPPPPQVLAGAGILVAAMAPTLGAGIAGAVVGGAAIGGVVGGMTLAARDPRVKVAAAELGQTVLADLQHRSRAFVPEMLGGISEVRAGWRAIGPDLDRIFASSRFVDPLVDGVISGSRRVISGVADMIENADPVVDQFAKSVSRIGDAVGDSFSLLANDADEGASAIDDLTTATVHFIGAVTGIVHGLAVAKGWFDRLDLAIDKGRFKLEDMGFAIDLTADGFKKGTPEAEAYRRKVLGTATAADEALLAGKGLDAGLGNTTDALQTAAAAARGQRGALSALSREMKAQADPVFGLMDAQQKLKQAQDDAAAATKKHGRNSVEAREATRKLAMAAIDLQGKAGALGATFNGKVTPQLYATLRAGGLTEKQINDVEREFRQAKGAADRYSGSYRAHVSVVGVHGVKSQLNSLLIQQQALKKGISVSAARSAFAKQSLADGGPVLGSSPHPRADNIPAMLTADEWVHPVAAVKAYGPRVMTAIQKREIPADDLRALVGGYAAGGRVAWPFPTTAAGSWVPSRQWALDRVTPAAPSGGATAPWMERMLERMFGVAMISGYRRGSRTLSGALSMHALNRAVDFPPIKSMARFMDQTYGSQMHEIITPWQEYNRYRGRRRHWSGAIWRQHAFGYGNAHNHFSMGGGGTIREPVFGVGRSGSTYSLGENYIPERVTPTWQSSGGGGGGTTVVQVTFSGPVGSRFELEQWLTGAVDNLKRKGKL